jgi:L-lactate dehydrogenase complex protein LldG
MASSREAILGAVREALEEAVLPSVPQKLDIALRAGDSAHESKFKDELEAVSGQLIQVKNAHDAADATISIVKGRGLERVVGWEPAEIHCGGLGASLAEAGIISVTSGDPEELSASVIGITGAEAGLVDTGSIVLRHGRGRSPLVSLQPETHIAILRRDRLFPGLDEYFASAAFTSGAMDGGDTSSLVLVTGPSRTADIEQALTLGVHGPKELIVVLWG